MLNPHETQPAESENQIIGYIVGGSLKENLQARLTIPAQDVQEGAFVVVESRNWLYYATAVDLRLGATDPRFADEQSEKRLPAELAALLHGQTLYTNLEILPSLMMERGPEYDDADYAAFARRLAEGEIHPQPIKTIPQHHAPVRMARAGDVAEIFGSEDKDGGTFFRIGETREQGLPICLNLDKFIQRSSGIFGATGTGKSFLTRVILSGLINAGKSSVLIFDMHSEYGPDDVASDTNKVVPGLRKKFGTKTRLAALGVGTQVRNQTPDFNIEIAEKDITDDDVLMLSKTLNLRETSATTLSALIKCFKQNWFHEFKQMSADGSSDEEGNAAAGSVAAWAEENGVNKAAAEGLHSKMRQLFQRPYIVSNPTSDSVSQIIDALEHGISVILSFGKYEQELDYLLVANLLTRRIRDAWEKKTNDYRSDKNKGEPRPLVIVVEEAHKLLNREMAAQTTFSTIAREMRKYYVTLLIIDQRPSQIYDEVMSQLGTRVSGWLGDEDDIRAVLSGLAGRDALRGMLARLQPKEEVLILGFGVPMPILVKSRRYDDQFWKEVLGKKDDAPFNLAQSDRELGF